MKPPKLHFFISKAILMIQFLIASQCFFPKNLIVLFGLILTDFTTLDTLFSIHHIHAITKLFPLLIFWLVIITMIHHSI